MPRTLGLVLGFAGLASVAVTAPPLAVQNPDPGTKYIANCQRGVGVQAQGDRVCLR